MGETKQEKKDAKMSDVDEHITNRYELKRRLGKGAYGIVWKAVDNETKDVVAVKKIFDAFRNQTDAQRTFREIMFLQAFRYHPNIIRLRGLHKATNNRDIYLVFDFMDTDLHHVIKRGTALKEVHKRYIMYQLFSATQYLHSGNVIHRDQKPSNVLINAECKIKIADFGLARSLAHTNEDEDDGILTDYVATRWYRAPEILVASKKYTKGVDMWSLGCILGEMLLGKPLFPGSSTVNQMERILAVLPEPTKKEIFNMCSGCGKGLLEGFKGPKINLRELVQSPCEEAMSLLNSLLVFDPARRLTAGEALKHPYVSVYANGREMILNKNVTPPLDDDIQLSVSDYRNKLYELIANARLKKKMNKQNLTPPTSFPIEQTAQKQIDYQKCDSKLIDGNLRTRPKRSSAEDGKEKFNGKLGLTKSDSIHKNGCQRRIGTSPHRATVSQTRITGWPDKQRILKTAQKPAPLKYRYDEAGGDGAANRPNNYLTTPQPPFRAALAQVKEKLRQAQALNYQSSLPKVAQKRDAGHNTSSPSHLTRYNTRQSAITSTALQEIRAMLNR